MRRHIPRALPASLCVVACSALVAAAQPSKPIRKRPKVQEICVVSEWGKPRCVRLADLKRPLTPAQVDRLRSLADALLADLGLEPGRSAQVSCGGRGVPATNLDSGPPRSQRKYDLGTSELAKLEQALAACRTKAVTAAGGPSPRGDSGYAAWVDSSVARAEQDLGTCRDSGNSAIAQGKTPAEKEAERLRRFQTVGVLQDSMPKGKPTTPGDAGSPGSSVFFELPKKTAPAKPPAADAGGAGGGTTPSTTAPPAPPPPTPEPGSPEWVDAGCGETPGCGPPPTPCQGDGCAPTCEERRQAWEMFKAYCEQSSWQAYPCVDFLRKVNGCVDMTLINPGPEGDLTCPESAREDKQTRARRAWADECKRRQWVMMPLPDGKALCSTPDVFAGPPDLRIDPCNDPRAMPAPDACPGGPSPLDSPAPKPPGPPEQPVRPPPP